MRTYATKSLRQLLRNNPDGMDVGTLANYLDREPENIRRRLKEMPDAYIDRWEGPNRGQYTAIWCVVIPPDNCPRPAKPMVAVRSRRRKDSRKDAQANN